MQDFCELCGRTVYGCCTCGLAQSLPRIDRGGFVEALNKTFPGAEVIANKFLSRARLRRVA